MIAHFHYRQRLGDIRSGNAQVLCLFELPQRFQLLFFIVFRHPQAILAQFATIGIRGHRLVQRGRIQQLVEQQRVTCQLAGHHRRCSTKADQVAEGSMVFHQQLKVGSSGHDAQQQLGQSRQSRGRVHARTHFGQQAWHQLIQHVTTTRTYSAFVHVVAEVGDGTQHLPPRLFVQMGRQWR
ncbi:hypothetical protein D3C80_1201620 [compost metagenome]